MRIVFIRSNPVSPYPRLEKTVNSLNQDKHEIHVLAWDRDIKYKKKESMLKLSNGEVNITRFGIPGKFGGGLKANLLPLLKFQMRIISWLYQNRKSYDAIHAYDFDTGFIALKVAKFLKKKLIYDIPDYYIDSHGLNGTKVGQYIQKAENNIINKADAVIICTEGRKRQIEGTFPNKLIIVHNSPVDIHKDRSNDSLLEVKGKSNMLKIVYVGILANSRFIKEIAEVVTQRDDCEFHIGGFGKLEGYFMELSRNHKNIYFYGKLPYNDTLRLEQECDVMVAMYNPKVPNHYFAAPNKFYEGLMLGKPLIMAKNTGMSNIIEENELGEVIDYNKQSLNKSIDNLIKKDNRIIVKDRARKLYEQNYSWIIMEKRLKDLYREL